MRFFFYVYEHLSACIYVYHVWPEEGVGALEIDHRFLSHCGCWELNLDLLQCS